MKVAVIGCGYVGQAVIKMVAPHHDLITYDPKQEVNPNIPDILESDVIFLCVPTKMNEDGSCDISIAEQWIRLLDGSNALIIMKSTVKPRTTEFFNKIARVNIVFSPEFIGEGSWYMPPPYDFNKDMTKCPQVILGGSDENCNKAIDFFMPILGPTKTYFKCTSTEAELIKYMENSYLATKVTFCNEFYEICKTVGADYHRVREGWLLDPRVEKTHTAVFPDKRGFGGKCLPKDVNALCHEVDISGYEPKFLKQILKSNEDFKKLNEKV